ncbi:ethanolamine kinase 1-like [Paramormyrops kingsleyae]|uniref:ethanolamine kinase n=1 Tax=Paramormyrops kingsleyae TaxID=1676925 RepID=A0A3B3T6Y2_9TELE|nr:ethanolamine kinase 1-like [Paramormyrops kingsleyae]
MEGRAESLQDPLPHLGIAVDENDPRSNVLVLLKELRPEWKPEEIKLKYFTEGITNQLIGCFVDSLLGDVVLVRIYGNKTELFVDRQREMENFRVLHQHDCAPELYCSFQNGICYEFVQGEVMDDNLLRQPVIYRLIAKEMARIHSIKPRNGSSSRPVLWEKLSELLCLVKAAHSGSPGWPGSEVPCFEVLVSEIEALKQHLSTVDSCTVLCHNDLLIKNIIYNKAEGVVRFIDFEYADFNYQAYDIGNHFNEFAGVNDVDYSLYPSQELQRDWLTAYLETYKECQGQKPTVSELEVQKLYVQVCKFSLAAHFSWGLWALLQARYSAIDFDFLRYAVARFDYYFQKKGEYMAMELP